ncbi:MAG: undecaprenyldiphospho-muramoylpentapeptide beta-N-acetylglucosaminyltransferase [Candidatus Cryptobacteroides sp.]
MINSNKGMEYRALRVIISGGGTGGHIFPAISIADKLKELNSDTEILFVGAKGKMEMDKVPAAGYKIVGLPISGLQRKFNLKNLINAICLPFKVLKSIRNASHIIDYYEPDIVIGVGGYASGPLLWAATRKGVPTIIQEQNGFAGLTNKILGKRVGKICVAYEGMDKFFPAEKIIITGNPIRKDIKPYSEEFKEKALTYYALNPYKKHIFIVGGSLGSYTLNKSMMNWIESGNCNTEKVEIIWQCGRYYKAQIDQFMKKHPTRGVYHFDFIHRMDYAYAASDIIISRSGASTVSELCAAHKAAIFVPSPNVAEDHQTHNAMALVNKGAALIVKDEDAPCKLMNTALALLENKKEIENIETNIAKLALPNAALSIAEEVYKILQ